LILLLGTLLIPSRAEAQITPFNVEVRVGAWISAADLVGAQGFEGKASAAASFGVHCVLNDGLTSYVAGFSEHRFGCTQAQCTEAVDFVSTSWELGVRVNFRRAGIVPWVSLGGSAALFEAHVETGGGVVSEGSDRGWGYEVGAGVRVTVRGPLAINPGVRYGRSDVDFASRGTLETRYIIVDLGLVLAF
jgi:opacity protein-like surface antigen